MFGCKHDYHLIDKTILPAPIEQLKDMGLKRMTGDSSLLEQKVVLVFKCSKCNKVYTERK